LTTINRPKIREREKKTPKKRMIKKSGNDINNSKIEGNDIKKKKRKK
jgi:hypothetical protein